MHDDPATGSPPPVTTQPGDPAAVGAIDSPRPTLIGEPRSPNAWVCPFLRATDDDDALGLPIESPDPTNRCASLHEAVPQSLRQQELVCLTSGHVNCPRYLRGSLGAPESLDRPRPTRTLTRATAGALIMFALAFAVSLAFVVSNGGLVLTVAVPTATAAGSVLGEVETSAPTAVPTPSPATPSPTAIATASPGLTPSPAPTPSPSPTATPSPTPSPTPTPPTKASASRLALLKRCSDAPNCYVYVIRSGVNLFSIASYFGVSLTTVKAMNPWTNNGLTVGRGLRIPTPTR